MANQYDEPAYPLHRDKTGRVIETWPDRSLIGTKVRRGNSTRTIVHIYDKVVGGVIVDSPMEGFKSWNLDELEMVKD